jgi:hypothetical protein
LPQVLQIGARRLKIGKSRLALDELEMHQPTGRVVDKYEQGALRTAILKPPMLAAVDLHQLAKAFAPATGLMDALSPLLAIKPQPRFDHPKPQRLTAERDPVNLAQLLGRQCRAEIPVPLANHRQRRSPQRCGLAPVAGATASLRDQACRTRGPVCLQQPEHLTAFEPQQLRHRLGRQLSLIQITQHLEPRQLPVAHQPNRHP